MKMSKRKLTPSEIAEIISQVDEWHDNDSVHVSVENSRVILRSQLEEVVISTSNISKLYKVTRKRWVESQSCVGEPVGVLAATHSIHGVTQNVLNTFHFAGVGDAAVHSTTMGLKQIRQFLHASHLAERHASVYIDADALNKRGSDKEKLRFLQSISKQLQSCYLHNLCGGENQSVSFSHSQKNSFVKISNGLKQHRWWKCWMKVYGDLPFSSSMTKNNIRKSKKESRPGRGAGKAVLGRTRPGSTDSEEWWTVVISLNRAKLFRYQIYPFQIRKAIDKANLKGVWCMENPMHDAAITLVISSVRAVNFDDSAISQYVDNWYSPSTKLMESADPPHGSHANGKYESQTESADLTKVTGRSQSQTDSHEGKEPSEKEEIITLLKKKRRRMQRLNNEHYKQEYIHMYIKERIVKALMAENNTKTPKFALISGIPGIIGTNLQYDSNEQCWFILTEGSNLPALYSHPFVDETRTMSDDIHEINEYLGISAVKNYLLRRLSAVSGFSGNNPAHLMLVIDHMTSGTSIKGLTRHGLDEENASPLGRMAFEQVGKNLTLATTTSAYESLTGVSARVLIGHPVLVGTNGPFEVTITNTKKVCAPKRQAVKRGAVPIGNKLAELPPELPIIELDDV